MLYNFNIQSFYSVLIFFALNQGYNVKPYMQSFFLHRLILILLYEQSIYKFLSSMWSSQKFGTSFI